MGKIIGFVINGNVKSDFTGLVTDKDNITRYVENGKASNITGVKELSARNIILQQVILRKLMEHITLLMAVWIEHIPA